MKTQDNLLKIEKKIWNNFINENRIGLYDGLSGFILFYDNMFQTYQTKEFEIKLQQIIEKTNELIEEGRSSINICSGISGYGFGNCSDY